MKRLFLVLFISVFMMGCQYNVRNSYNGYGMNAKHTLERQQEINKIARQVDFQQQEVKRMQSYFSKCITGQSEDSAREIKRLKSCTIYEKIRRRLPRV
ncbi:MAG: hypothetical protein QM500_17760 [Methylococcales bacterium]